MDQSITTTASQLLPEPQAAAELATKGYTVFPFLSSADTDALTRYYFEIQQEEPGHFYSSTHAKDPAFRKKTSDYIKDIISPRMSSVFKNYRLLGGAFVVKPPHGKGILQPHQDWNIVDEAATRSFNLWIPLTDVTIENGAVFVLPGSHSKLPTFRGPGIASLFKNIEQDIWNTLTPLPMKAGEALFYDHALLHGSPVNSTDKIRLGIVCGVISNNADMQLCFVKNDSIEIYKADEHFFMEKDPANGPAGLSFIKTETPDYSSFTLEQYHSLFLGKTPAKTKTWLAKIFGR